MHCTLEIKLDTRNYCSWQDFCKICLCFYRWYWIINSGALKLGTNLLVLESLINCLLFYIFLNHKKTTEKVLYSRKFWFSVLNLLVSGIKFDYFWKMQACLCVCQSVCFYLVSYKHGLNFKAYLSIGGAAFCLLHEFIKVMFIY